MRFIPTRFHGILDYVLGLLLAASPWLLGFAREACLPHLILGLYLALSSLAAHRLPSRSYRRMHARNGNVR